MNIAHWLRRGAVSNGEIPAIAVGHRVALSYREVADRSAGLARAMRRDWKLKSGDRVAIVSENHVCYVEALFAAWWAGLVAVPLDARLHPSEIEWILAHSGASAMFISEETAGWFGAFELPAGTVVFGSPTYERLADSGGIAVTPRAGDDVAWLFYTSGTTGRPKGALLTHRNLAVAGISHLAEVDPTTAGDVLIHSASMSHASGMLSVAHVLCLGLNVIPETKSFDAGETLELINRWGRASIFVAPTMLRRLVELGEDVDPGAVRSIIWGGAPLLVSDAIRALDRFGPCLVQVYGQGESPMTISSLSKGAIANRADPAWRQRLASAGLPRAVVEVVVAGSDDTPLPPGEIGEVLVRGDTVMSGYWNDSEATEAALRAGFLHTGDMGVMDEGGFLTLKDRSKDVIISGGMNIYPREVEEVLAGARGVREVAVIGRPDDEWGEVVVAYIAGDADPRDLDRACLARIARFKRPRDYVYVPTLPKNNNGKIVKAQLRELDRGDRATAVHTQG